MLSVQTEQTKRGRTTAFDKPSERTVRNPGSAWGCIHCNMIYWMIVNTRHVRLPIFDAGQEVMDDASGGHAVSKTHEM